MGIFAQIIGISLDPFILIPAIAAGLLTKKHPILVGVPLLVAVLLTLLMGQPPALILARFLGGLIIAYATYGIKKAVKK